MAGGNVNSPWGDGWAKAWGPAAEAIKNGQVGSIFNDKSQVDGLPEGEETLALHIPALIQQMRTDHVRTALSLSAEGYGGKLAEWTGLADQADTCFGALFPPDHGEPSGDNKLQFVTDAIKAAGALRTAMQERGVLTVTAYMAAVNLQLAALQRGEQLLPRRAQAYQAQAAGVVREAQKHVADVLDFDADHNNPPQRHRENNGFIAVVGKRITIERIDKDNWTYTADGKTSQHLAKDSLDQQVKSKRNDAFALFRDDVGAVSKPKKQDPAVDHGPAVAMLRVWEQHLLALQLQSQARLAAGRADSPVTGAGATAAAAASSTAGDDDTARAAPSATATS